MNYYYKEKIEYIFYDTLKQISKILEMEKNLKNGNNTFKFSTKLWNVYSIKSPTSGGNNRSINLSVNDMAVSRTVKEVLDTLCLFKQIHTENLGRYQYSLSETDKEVFDIEIPEDPDVRYYSCVVDKK